MMNQAMKARQTFLAATLALSLVYPLLLFRAGYLVGKMDRGRALQIDKIAPVPRRSTRFGFGFGNRRNKNNTRAQARNKSNVEISKGNLPLGSVPKKKKTSRIKKTQKQKPQENRTAKRKKHDDGTRSRTKAIQRDVVTSDKPLFILHVGPEKTATTTLQWFANEYAEELERDNVYYLGHGRNKEKNLHQLYNLCADAKLKNKAECNEQWKQFRKKVHFHYRMNHTIFVSEELFSGLGTYDLQQHLWRRLTPFKKHWNVRVIFSYRRFHEWLPSRYYQRFDPSPPFAEIPEERARMKQHWPGGKNGGKKIVTIEKFLNQTFDKMESNSPLIIKKKWDSNFEDVRVFNMHEHNENDMHTGFYCNMIPEAAQFCQKLKTQAGYMDAITKNDSNDKVVQFDMIAVRALEKKLFKKGLPRTAVAKAVEKFATEELHLTTLADFPLLCPSKKLTDKLLKASMSMEQGMVPEFHASPRGKYDLKLSFEQALEEKRFCSVDVDKVVDSERWTRFFRTRLAR